MDLAAAGVHPMEVVLGRRAHSRSDVRVGAHDLLRHLWPRLVPALHGARVLTAFRALMAAFSSE